MKVKLLKKFRKQVLRKYKPVHLKDGWAIRFYTYTNDIWCEGVKSIHYAYRHSKTKEEAIYWLFKMEGHYEMMRLIEKYKQNKIK